jgi:putative copper resistance protein D
VLFAAVVIGDDPLPSRPAHPVRLLLVAALVPAHAVVGIALLSGTELLAGTWYEGIDRTWGASPLQDQRTGGGLFWIAGEVLGLVLALMVTARWMRAAEREARRLDSRSPTVAGVTT